MTTLSTLAFKNMSCSGRTRDSRKSLGQRDAEMAKALRRHKTASQTLWVEDVVFEARDLLDIGLSRWPTKMIIGDARENCRPLV